MRLRSGTACTSSRVNQRFAAGLNRKRRVQEPQGKQRWSCWWDLGTRLKQWGLKPGFWKSTRFLNSHPDTLSSPCVVALENAYAQHAYREIEDPIFFIFFRFFLIYFLYYTSYSITYIVYCLCVECIFYAGIREFSKHYKNGTFVVEIRGFKVDISFRDSGFKDWKVSLIMYNFRLKHFFGFF